MYHVEKESFVRWKQNLFYFWQRPLNSFSYSPRPCLYRSGLNSTHWQSSFQPESSEDGNLTALHFEVGFDKYIFYKSLDLVNQSWYEMYCIQNQREQNKIYAPCTLRTAAIVLSIKLETLSNDNDGGVWGRHFRELRRPTCIYSPLHSSSSRPSDLSTSPY